MKCVAYFRTANREDNYTSLLIQMEMVKDFIAQNNWQLESVYADIGFGIDINENLHKMIEDAKKGKIDVIIASDPARISRNREVLFNILAKLRKESKVHIITVDNQINTFLNSSIS